MISFDPLIPVWLLLTALAGVCFVIYRTVGRKRLRLVCWLEAVLLGVMIADPVVTVRRPDSKNGGVALLVDSSASMQVPDADGKTRLDAAKRLRTASCAVSETPLRSRATPSTTG